MDLIYTAHLLAETGITWDDFYACGLGVYGCYISL